MLNPVPWLLLSSLFITCKGNRPFNDRGSIRSLPMADYTSIGEVPLPPGYERITIEPGSFGNWLRQVKLRKDNTVYLYNGTLKKDQSIQFAVLAIPTGNKDLQQCADAVIRLRAEYLFSTGKMDAIRFKAGDGTELSFAKWLHGQRYKFNGNKLISYQTTTSIANKRKQLEQFLEVVFSYCGTYTLDRETKAVYDPGDIQPGDVFVKGGSPGHAMIVVDVAINHKSEKIYMLAQSYMPAQDIHIVKNPIEKNLTPWYRVDASPTIITPEWVFYRYQLKRW